MEGILYWVEAFGQMLLAGILALSPGILFWLVVAGIWVTASRRTRSKTLQPSE